MAGRAEVEALNREAIGLILMKVDIFTLDTPSQLFLASYSCRKKRLKKKSSEVKTSLKIRAR
jgi:hypothetical protein